jgi:CopA family copper-resistance protein
MLNNSCLFILIILAFFICKNSAAQHHHSSPLPTTLKETSLLKPVKNTKIKAQAQKKIIPLSKVHNIHLTIDYKWVNFGGKKRRGLSINQQIPGPTLHFKEGDRVNLHVHNLLHQGTSLHWHGLLVPWQMDGVEGVSQTSIPAGGEFVYHFKLRQAGTYWYHAHEDVQEQEGLYGAFIIDPLSPSAYHYDKDAVVVLSDWSNTPAEQIYYNLKKDGDYYAPRFPLQASLLKFIHDVQHASSEERRLLWSDYSQMQQMRMGLYDLSDVAYDAFLLNGHTSSNPWELMVKKGDTVRLRFIGAASSTIYRIKIPNAHMQVVHVQGNDVIPHTVSDFTLAPGETWDILVKIQQNRPYPIYAESIDKMGAAIGLLKTNRQQTLQIHTISPFPEPRPITQQMMTNMMSTAHHSPSHDMSSMKSMKMPSEPMIIGDHISHTMIHAATHGTKYQSLTAAVPTNSPNKPVAATIKMELFGYMGRYIWMINGLPEYKSKPLILKPNKRYRFIFTNNSMMRHPMHLHGHWFILRNGYESHDPLLHTIEVPPGATAVADVDTDASGQWFFHCHHLYHMKAGMSRVFQYQTIIELAQGSRPAQRQILPGQFVNRPIVRVDEAIALKKELIFHPMAHTAGVYVANYLHLGADPYHDVQELTYQGLYGSDYHKLELKVKDAELNENSIENADLDVFYWHPISQFWALKGGINYTYRPAEIPYWQPGIGLEGLMPFFIEIDARAYFPTDNAKLDIELSRDTQISNNFFIQTGIRSILGAATSLKKQIGNGLNQMRYTLTPYYRLFPGFSVFTEFEYEQNYGRFKNLQLTQGESAHETTITFGINSIF